MLVKFKRPYFSKDGVSYPARQIVEVPDDTLLPSDAEKVDMPKGIDELPSDAPPALPGFGAKPLHHQALADVGAEPTHLIATATGGEASGIVMTDKEAAETVKDGGPQDPKKVSSAKDDKSSKDAAKNL